MPSDTPTKNQTNFSFSFFPVCVFHVLLFLHRRSHLFIIVLHLISMACAFISIHCVRYEREMYFLFHFLYERFYILKREEKSRRFCLFRRVIRRSVGSLMMNAKKAKMAFRTNQGKLTHLEAAAEKTVKDEIKQRRRNQQPKRHKESENKWRRKN